MRRGRVITRQLTRLALSANTAGGREGGGGCATWLAVGSSVPRWPYPPPNNSKQAVQKNNLRWKISGGESGRGQALVALIHIQLNSANFPNFSAKNLNQNQRNYIIHPLTLGYIVVVL